jgi:hypothetical protein
MNDIDVCTVFKNISHDVWRSIEKTKSQNRSPKEEAITEERVFSSLFELPQEKIKTIEYSKIKEGREGADWEWVFIGKDQSTFSIRVQAKVINPHHERFEELHYKTKSNGYQSDLLIDRAKRNQALPLYCLYNYFEGADLSKMWSCSSHQNTLNNYGCGLIDAYEVKQLRLSGNKKDLTDVMANLVPWHCTVCCKMDNELSLPHRVRQYWAVRLGKEIPPKLKKSDLGDSLFKDAMHERMIIERIGIDTDESKNMKKTIDKFLPNVLMEPSVRIKRILDGEIYDAEELSTIGRDNDLIATTLFFED